MIPDTKAAIMAQIMRERENPDVIISAAAIAPLAGINSQGLAPDAKRHRQKKEMGARVELDCADMIAMRNKWLKKRWV